jgi:hypothetical protein
MTSRAGQIRLRFVSRKNEKSKRAAVKPVEDNAADHETGEDETHINTHKTPDVQKTGSGVKRNNRYNPYPSTSARYGPG